MKESKTSLICAGIVIAQTISDIIVDLVNYGEYIVPDLWSFMLILNIFAVSTIIKSKEKNKYLLLACGITLFFCIAGIIGALYFLDFVDIV